MHEKKSANFSCCCYSNEVHCFIQFYNWPNRNHLIWYTKHQIVHRVTLCENIIKHVLCVCFLYMNYSFINKSFSSANWSVKNCVWTKIINKSLRMHHIEIRDSRDITKWHRTQFDRRNRKKKKKNISKMKDDKNWLYGTLENWRFPLISADIKIKRLSLYLIVLHTKLVTR